MCRRFIPIDRDEVAHIAAEIERDLAAHADELASLDPLKAYEAYLFAPDAGPEAAQPDRAARRAEREEAPVQLSLFDDGSDGSREAAEARGTGAPARASRPEALPSSVVPLIVASGDGCGLAVAHMAWGYEVPWKNGPVFNTRIETALRGEGSMWAESFARRRCLVPARGFFESHANETVPSERTGRPVKRQYAFAAPDGAPLLLAGVHDRGRFSLVTTEPNSVVAPVHNRMPLALGPSEAALWLRGVYEPLLDRGAVRLTARPER
ncbi:MAG: SOS response-associated peptidase family protein [Eggerthella lenta]|nr:SOS response-associated peptidase family protein [Eggerthella lenta]